MASTKAFGLRMASGRPWLLAMAWGCFLAPMFFGSYLGALEVVDQRASVPSLVFSWEHWIPFWPWTVVPYWSEDLLYALSLFLCATPRELHTHAFRLVLAQAIAIPIFLLFPLRLTSTLPAEQGIYAPLFDALGDLLDKPYNLAPSLHIAIAIILCALYIRHLNRPLRAVAYVWSFLICLSTLTAYQHHFFDIPTGASLGVFCLWALPFERPSPFSDVMHYERSNRAMALGGLYSVGSLTLIGLAYQLSGAAWWLLWPAQSLLLVAVAYLGLGPKLFDKDRDGRMSAPARWLLFPYVVMAKINALLWSRKPDSEVVPGVWLGRVAHGAKAPAVLDLTAEIPAPVHEDWCCMPSLDLVPPAPGLLADAAAHIESRVLQGKTILVACALGYSRSASALATWLVAYGRAGDTEAAVAMVRAARPQVVLHPAHQRAIDAAVSLLRREQ